MTGSYGKEPWCRRTSVHSKKILTPLERTPSPFKSIASSSSSSSNSGSSNSNSKQEESGAMAERGGGIGGGVGGGQQHRVVTKLGHSTSHSMLSDMRVGGGGGGGADGGGGGTSSPSILIEEGGILFGGSGKGRQQHHHKKPMKLTPRNDLPVPQISPATVHVHDTFSKRRSGGGGRVKVSGWTSKMKR